MDNPAEAIERAALEDLHAAASPELRRRLGLEARDQGGAFVSVAAALPASAIVVNRALGLGLAAPASEETVDAIVATYRAAGAARYFVHLHPDARPAEIGAWLEARGLERTRGWQKFVRGHEPVPEPATDLAIREVGPEHARDFAAIVCDAFDLGEAAVPWLAALPGRARWHVFMSFEGETPAGAGALFLEGDRAWTDFGATAPAFRRRGSQSALLRRRLRFALDRGCREIFTCTGEEVPGDPQHSYANILKAGFREDYLRANHAPPKAG